MSKQYSEWDNFWYPIIKTVWKITGVGVGISVMGVSFAILIHTWRWALYGNIATCIIR